MIHIRRHARIKYFASMFKSVLQVGAIQVEPIDSRFGAVDIIKPGAAIPSPNSVDSGEYTDSPVLLLEAFSTIVRSPVEFHEWESTKDVFGSCCAI